MMIVHRVKTKRSDITHYFNRQDLYDSAIDPEYGDKTSAMIQKCHVAYDHDNHRFVKERGGYQEVMNAMLLVKRFELKYGRISPELQSLVEDHV